VLATGEKAAFLLVNFLLEYRERKNVRVIVK
jgi:hypothetical protein